MNYNMPFSTEKMSERLKIAMSVKDLNSRDIEKILGQSPSSINKLVNGKHSITTENLWVLSNELDLSMDYMFRGLDIAKNIFIKSEDKDDSTALLNEHLELFLAYLYKLESGKRKEYVADILEKLLPLLK